MCRLLGGSPHKRNVSFMQDSFFVQEFVTQPSHREIKIWCNRRTVGKRKGEGMKKIGKRYVVLAAGISGTLAVCAVNWRFAGTDTNAAQKAYREMQLTHGDLELVFTGEGTTAEGMIQQEAGFDVTAADFIVEESYVVSGDEVKQGDALYQLSAASMEEASAYYEENIAKAAKAADRAKTAYESGMAEAEYTKTTAKAKAGSAKEIYDAANSKAEENVAKAQEAIEEAEAQIHVYQTNLEQGVYETDAGVREKKQKAEERKKAENQAEKEYQKAKNAYDEAVRTLNDQITKLQQKAAEAADGVVPAALALELGEASQDLAQKKEACTKAEEALNAAQEEAKKAEEEYRTANTSYEKAVGEASARKEELENSLASLQRAYTNAVNAAELEKVQNKNAYDTAVLQGEYAEVDFENTEDSLKAEYHAAQEELDKLKEEQKALLALEDGVVTAAYDGILSQVPYEAGNTLQSGWMLAGYSDTDILTAAVEVSQEDIAKIAVGDTAEVSLPGMRMGNVKGVISAIASEATSGRSISNVTYTVEVSIDNENGAILSGTSAYVTFLYGEVLDTDYILTEALYDIEGSTATVKVYGENGEVEERQVTIGETTNRYTVVTGGLDADTVCVIEEDADAAGVKRDAQAEEPENQTHGSEKGETQAKTGAGEDRLETENPDAESKDMEKDRRKEGGIENGKMER